MAADAVTLIIPSRFNGPPDSANGGYAAGRAAALVDGPAEITLRAPPPLDAPLRSVSADGRVDIFDGDTLVMQARARAPLARPTVTAPSLAAARAAASHYNPNAHLLPTCFVCGPKRAPGDGLRIFAAREDGAPLVADVWTPSADLADADGLIAPEFVWAALDCPGYFALGIGMALLGRLGADVLERPRAGEPHVVVGWSMGADGRKHAAGTALFTAEGRLLAHAEALWIALKADAV